MFVVGEGAVNELAGQAVTAQRQAQLAFAEVQNDRLADAAQELDELAHAFFRHDEVGSGRGGSGECTTRAGEAVTVGADRVDGIAVFDDVQVHAV